MTGEYEHSLDAKGRLFIPAKLREELGNEFFVTVSAERCLTIYPAESWRTFTRRVDAMPFVRQKKMRPLFSLATRCEPDGQGRVLLPLSLREYAGLTREAAVVGCGSYAEIWDLARWREVNAAEMTPENIARVMEELEL